LFIKCVVELHVLLVTVSTFHSYLWSFWAWTEKENAGVPEQD